MRHLVYAIKVMVNEDLKAQERRRSRRASRRRVAKAVASHAPVRPAPSAEPATRSSARWRVIRARRNQLREVLARTR
jgi:hypothetical protein